MTAPTYTSLHAEQAATYHLTETVQWTTLAIAVGLVVLVVMCFRSMLWDPWTRQWSIDDAEASIDELTFDYFSGRDMHFSDVRDAMRDARVSAR